MQEIRTVPLGLTVEFRTQGGGLYDLRNCSFLEDDDSLLRFDFHLDKYAAPADIEDPWEMRSEFLDSSEGGSSLLGMTMGWGRFGDNADDLLVSDQQFEKRGPGGALEDEYREWRSLFLAAMLLKMDEWPKLKANFDPRKVRQLCNPVPVNVEWRGGHPVGVVKCAAVLPALIATLQVDALMNAKFRFCACVGCSKSFKVKRKDQRYCDEVCKHKQVVRNGRAKAAQTIAQR